MARCFKLIIIAAAISVIFPAGAARAHTLAKDGRISAFLHIAPDDQPKAGKINTVHFYFNDQDFRFTMEGCFCNASVKEDKQVLFKGPLAAEDIRVGKLNVLLPDDNKSYDVVVNGTPKTAGYFQPFKLKFDIDVGNPPPETDRPNHNWFWAIFAVAVAGGGMALAYRPLRRRVK